MRSAPGWDVALAATITDLEAAGLRPERLDAGHDRLGDIQHLWKALDDSAGTSWTWARLVAEAASRLGERRELWLFPGPVLAAIRGYESMVEASLVRGIPDVTLAIVAARPRRPRFVLRQRALFGDKVADLFERSQPPIRQRSERDLLATWLFEEPQRWSDPSRAVSSGPDGTVHLEQYPGLDAEVEAAADWVARQVLQRGASLAEIAVLSVGADPYLSLLATRIRRLPWPAGTEPVVIAGGLPLGATAGGARTLALVRTLRGHLGIEAVSELLPLLAWDGEAGRLRRDHAIESSAPRRARHPTTSTARAPHCAPRVCSARQAPPCASSTRSPARSIRPSSFTASHAQYGARGVGGKTALELVAEDEAEALPADERAEIDALLDGWFSVFEVLHIKIDEAIEVRDIFKRRRFWIAEKTGTRGIALGDLLAGWIMEIGDRRVLEGATARIPRMVSATFVTTMREEMDRLRIHGPSSWRRRHELLPPLVSALAARLFRQPPSVRLVDREGEDLLMAEARYLVHRPAAVRATLDMATELTATDRGYLWIEPTGSSIIAAIDVTTDELHLRTHSRRRHDRARAWLEQQLGDAIAHRGDSFLDPTSEAFRAQAAPTATEDPPAEVLAVMAELLQGQLRAWLDTEIPALGGRTPRQGVRSAKGRDDVAAMLLEQERILRTTPAADQLAFGAMWADLGLSYPDPPR